MKFKSKKPIAVRGEGPGRKYPRVNLPIECADMIGKFYDVERNGDVVTITPFDPSKADKKAKK